MAKKASIAALILLALCCIFASACGDDAEPATTADATPPDLIIKPLTIPYDYDDEIPLIGISTPSFSGVATTNTVAGNYITSVQCRIDGGDWMEASPVSEEGFDGSTESYKFTVTSPLASGTHTIEARATDVDGNTTEEESYATLTFRIELPQQEMAS